MVYLTSRTQSNADAAARKIRESYPKSQGRLEGLQLDLTDLRQPKQTAEEFLKREKTLDVLFNNAGIQLLPLEGKTEQGHEIRMGSNCLAHYILTQELVPTLRSTAALRREQGRPEGCVRVLFAGSIVIDMDSPQGGIDSDENGAPRIQQTTAVNYAHSKAGNLMLAKHFREELRKDGVFCLCFNPGNVNDRYTVRRNFQCTDFQAVLLEWFFLHPLIKGAYTELWAGLTEDFSLDDPCLYVAPWGQKNWNRADIEEALTKGAPEKFASWCWRETKAYR